MTVPTAPGGLPLIGHGLPMVRDPLSFLTSLPRYGDVVRIRLGTVTAFVINDAGLVRSVLVGESGTFDQGQLVDSARPLLGRGVGMLNGEEHRRHRRLMQSAFHRERIAAYATTMSRLAAERAASWRPGHVLAVDEEMNELALLTVATTLFSADFTDAIEEIKRSLPVALEEIPRRALAPALLLRLPTRRNRRFRTAVDRLHRTTRQAVAAGRGDRTDRGDLLSSLLRSRDHETGTGLSDDQVHDQLVNMMVAGTETTGAALAWAFHELGTNPGIEARLHDEVDEVLGGRAAEFDDISRLDYTRRVVQETLRRYPPYIILRHAPATVTIGGTTLPEGASVLFSPYALHHDARVFPQPGRFDPDRWLPERSAGLARGACIPFGGGARQCPGNHFALTELVIHLATIAGRWRLRPVVGARVREVARGAAVHPGALRMTAIPRGQVGVVGVVRGGCGP
ncbi:cytochrome P450 [Streptomyces sp. RB6PN25]|uniref:Cytochrome P450 n=1 Tax=Streptomyces humicola TaxID=2953240 RepID=A0ABT1PU26_9ACTN|nr:cytochrome P450 [Streptomyces humicola]MCQ4081186.1 cytochrome P450 [Streptomyces humicola]